LSVTGLRVPDVLAIVTVAPPLVRLFPAASFNWTVMVDVATPLASMDVGDAVMVEVVASAGPGTNVTTALSVIAMPPIVPVIVAMPGVAAAVRTAV